MEVVKGLLIMILFEPSIWKPLSLYLDGTSVNNTSMAPNFKLGISILTFNPSPKASAPGIPFGLNPIFTIMPMCVLVPLKFVLGSKIS